MMNRDIGPPFWVQIEAGSIDPCLPRCNLRLDFDPSFSRVWWGGYRPPSGSGHPKTVGGAHPTHWNVSTMVQAFYKAGRDPAYGDQSQNSARRHPLGRASRSLRGQVPRRQHSASGGDMSRKALRGNRARDSLGADSWTDGTSDVPRNTACRSFSRSQVLHRAGISRHVCV